MSELPGRKPKRTLVASAIIVLFVLYVSVLLPKASAVISAFMPLLVGIAIAYCLNIIGKFLGKIILPHAKKTATVRAKKVLTILIAFLLVLSIIILCVAIVVPELKNTVTAFTEGFPGLYSKVADWFANHSDTFPGIAGYMMNSENEPDVANILNAVSSYLLGGVGGIIDSATTLIFSTVDIIYSVVISIILSLYLLAGKERMLRQRDRLIAAYVKQPHAGRLHKIMTVTNKTFGSFIIGQVLQAVILAVLCILFMLIFGFDQPVMVGIFVGVMSLIPMVGSIIGSAVGTLIVLTQNAASALWFLLFMIALFQIVGNIIYPKLMGESIGLPSLWVLAAVVVGGALFGVLGMILCVPITAVVYKLIRFDVQKREKEMAEAAAANENTESDPTPAIKTDETHSGN